LPSNKRKVIRVFCDESRQTKPGIWYSLAFGYLKNIYLNMKIIIKKPLKSPSRCLWIQMVEAGRILSNPQFKSVT